MSLVIYFDNCTGKKINDVESAFYNYGVKFNDYSVSVVKDIDKGDLISNAEFVDRFGRTISVEFLSTGCKAALIVPYAELPVNLIECGINAVQSIISKCTSGSIVIDSKPQFIPNEKIDVVVDGKHFNSGNDLMSYKFF